jgi:hypothetical protein
MVLTVHYTQFLSKDSAICNEDPEYILRDCLDNWVSVHINIFTLTVRIESPFNFSISVNIEPYSNQCPAIVFVLQG